MNTANTTSLQFQQSLDVLQELDVACTSFERALQRGELLNINELVTAASPDAHPQLLRDLLTLEMEYRSKSGESPTLDQFCDAFRTTDSLLNTSILSTFFRRALAISPSNNCSGEVHTGMCTRVGTQSLVVT